MNWNTIKHIYFNILVLGFKIEYLGGDRYKLSEYKQNRQKLWEVEFENGSIISERNK